MDANFSSAAVGHTFSRWTAWDKCYKKLYFCLSFLSCCQELQILSRKFGLGKGGITLQKYKKNAAKVVDVLALPKSLLILYFVIVQNQEKLELYWNYDCWERVWIPFSLKMAV